jgi:serine/threonine protein kinase
VKVIPKQRNGATAEHVTAKIQQEVEILRRMQGRPEALKLKGVFEDDENAYIVTELCRGGTLERFLATCGALSEQEAAGVIHDILSVLAECHRQRICYADVKPANFLLKEPYSDNATESTDLGSDSNHLAVRVADFGCSQHVTKGSKLAKKNGHAAVYGAGAVHALLGC